MVVRVPPAVMSPLPFIVKGPSSVMTPVGENATAPELVIVSGPVFVVVIFPLKLKAKPESEIPSGPVVESDPLNVAVSTMFVKEIEDEEIDWEIKFSAPVTWKAPSGMVWPADPRVIVPLPAWRVRF